MQRLAYSVSFNNEPNATAPAQQVVVTEPLGSNVNLATLSLGIMVIPKNGTNIQVTVPPSLFNPSAGVNEFTTTVDLRPTQSLLVNIDVLLNPANQILTWTLTSIDPATGQLPQNPLVGFLPPGAGASVAFSVVPKAGLVTESQISEQATIVFNGLSPMSTAVWTNTVDSTPPVSQVAALPAMETNASFKVQWSRTDQGSGIEGYTDMCLRQRRPICTFLDQHRRHLNVFRGRGRSHLWLLQHRARLCGQS